MTKEQYQRTLDKFRLYYNRKISPELHKLEKKRKQLTNLFILAIVLFLLLTYLLFLAHVPALTLFALIPIAIFGFYMYNQIKGFRAEFKPKVVELILEFIDAEIESGNTQRLLEIEQRIQAYNMKIKELEHIISLTKQKLYYKIEQRIEDIARNIESGMENDVTDIVKERVLLLDQELQDLKNKIRNARSAPDKNSAQRILDMEAEHFIVEKKIHHIKLSLEEGLEEQIANVENQVRALKGRKQNLIMRIGEHLKTKLNYEYNKKISKATFDSSGIFNVNISSYKGEDYISGYIGTASFEMSELEVLRLSPVRSLYETIFRGIFFKANFYYNTGGGLVVFIPQEDRQELSETIRGITSKGGQRISLPSRELNERFVAYATAEVDVNSFLSQEAFKFILDYKKQSGKKVYMSFTSGHAYIAITETKDILEPKVFSSNANYRLIREYFEDILLIVSIVEDFDLNH